MAHARIHIKRVLIDERYFLQKTKRVYSSNSVFCFPFHEKKSIYIYKVKRREKPQVKPFACWEKFFHEICFFFQSISCIFLWGASYPDIRNKIIIGHAVYHPCEEYFRIYKDFTCYMQRIIVCMYVCFLVMVWLGKFLSFLVNKGLFYKCKRGWKGDEIKWCMVLNLLEINSLWKKNHLSLTTN